jgi:nucleotide-binding universal stress UspA family protein
MEMAKRILVPLDGFLRAEAAIPVAARLARADNGTVILAYVTPEPGERNPSDMDQLGELAHMDVYARADAAAMYLRFVAADEALADVRTTTAVYAYGGVSTILAAARTQAADAIVLWDGRTFDGDGDGRTRPTLAERLARRAPMPVLVVREEWPLGTSNAGASRRPLRAVVALDGTPSAEAILPEAAELAAALAGPRLAALHLAQVTHERTAMDDARAYLSSVAHDIRRELLGAHGLLLTWSVLHAQDVAGALVAHVDHPRRASGLDTSLESLYQPAGAGEIDPAEFDGGDLLVLADRDPQWTRFGSSAGVIEDALRTARCPVLIIRPSLAAPALLGRHVLTPGVPAIALDGELPVPR